MKRTSVTILLFFSVLHVFSQNWTTHNGNNERNGLSETVGPQNLDTPVWTINDAAPTGLGMNIYSFGDRFVTSRVDYSPYSAIIECRDLKSGQLLWTSPGLGGGSILYAMGFNEDAVYAHDYGTSLFYALDPVNGSVKWVTTYKSYTFGPMDGVIYTCDRNIIINGDVGSVDESTLCVDKETGEVLWANANWFAVTPNETKAAHGDRLYMIAGALNQPKQLVAVDLRNGENLYYSEDLPGDGDQEGPIAIAPDGILYFRRDGGDFFAVRDNGSGFDVLWTYTPVNMGLFVMNYGVEPDGNVLVMDNGKIFRLSRIDGAVLDSSVVSGIVSGRISIGADSTVYVNDTDGKYYAFSYDLQMLKWQLNLSGNYYAGPALSKDGMMVVCGSGSSIKAFRFEGPHSPTADFAASSYRVYQGESVSFFDQSSFSPTAWHWEFPGGNPSASTDQNPLDIVYPDAGTFDVTLIAINDLGNDTLTRKCHIEVLQLNNIFTSDIPGAIRLYPNPAGNFLLIDAGTAKEIIIYNTLGQLVYSSHAAEGQLRIDVSAFPEGVYVIRIMESKGTKEARFIVRH